MELKSLFVADNLEYYLDAVSEKLSEECVLTITLTQEQCAAILQAHDYGIARATSDAIHHLDFVIGKLKEQIWP